MSAHRSIKIKREALYSVPELKDRGWTKRAIEVFLYSNAGAPMKFYLRERVHEIERTEHFRTWQAKSKSRKNAADKAVVTRMLNMKETVRKVELTIVRGKSDEEIYQLALATHGGNYKGDRIGEFRWSKQSARNCIRHNLTNYEDLWSLINRGETGAGAYQILRERIDALIDEAYPQFANNEPLGDPT